MKKFTSTHLFPTRAWLLGLVALSALSSTRSAWAAPERARSADSFVDSIGVNIHVHYMDTPYGNFERVKQSLLDLGVRHVRDGMVDSSWQPYFDHLNELGRLGIKSTLIVGVPDRWNNKGIAPDRIIPVADKLSDSIEAFENTNEHDIMKKEGADWAAEVKAQQKALWTVVRGSAKWKNTSILGPSIVFADYNLVGDLSRWMDYGNFHPYPGGLKPTNRLEENLGKQKIVSGSKPVMATETGYQNAVTTNDGHKPASQWAEAKYQPRLFFEYFNRGIARTFDYELVNSFNNGADEVESNFGLMEYDFTPKPAFHAIKNLIALLRDPAKNRKTFVPATLDYEVVGGNFDLHHALLQKRDGTFWLALWQDVSSWDIDKRQNLLPAPLPITLKLKTRIKSGATYLPSQFQTPSSRFGAVQELPLSVSDQVLLIQLSPR